MRVEKEIIQVGDLELEFRSPEIADAKMALEHVVAVCDEAEYLQREGDEILLTLEEEEQHLQRYLDNPISSMIGVFHENRLIGIGDLRGNPGTRKEIHKAGLGISIRKEYTDRGIGRVLMNQLIKHGKKMGLEMIILGLFADNKRAHHLYQSLGFVEFGRLIGSYRYKDGRHGDEIFMVLNLKD